MTDGELNTKFENLENCQDELKTKTIDMVNWKTFVWIMGTLVTIAIAIIGWRINVTNVLADKLDANNAQFAIIQTQLSEIKIQQAEIMKDIQWMKQR